jgi:CheY-like chemotaxis protein
MCQVGMAHRGAKDEIDMAIHTLPDELRTLKNSRPAGSPSSAVGRGSEFGSPWREGAIRRKVLIVEDDLSISNLLYVLLEGLNYDGEVAVGGRQALAMIARDSFDAILLDLRYSNLSAEQWVSQIAEIQPSVLDRVLVITGEVDDPKVLDLLERHCLPHVQQNRLMEDIHQRLLSLWGLLPQTPVKA